MLPSAPLVFLLYALYNTDIVGCKNNKSINREEKTHGKSIKLYWTDAHF